MASGNDIRDDPVSQLLDFVLQRQLLLLHASKLELIAIPAGSKHLDFPIETAVLDLEKFKYLSRIVVVHEPILQEVRLIVTVAAVNGEPLSPPAGP
jgi:hypothetical protein